MIGVCGKCRGPLWQATANDRAILRRHCRLCWLDFAEEQRAAAILARADAFSRGDAIACNSLADSGATSEWLPRVWCFTGVDLSPLWYRQSDTVAVVYDTETRLPAEVL